MRTLALLLFLFPLAGCSAQSVTGTDVAPPYDGQAIRFVVDRITLPRTSQELGVPYRSDGRPRNQLGNIVATLHDQSDDATATLPAMLAAGALAPEVAIISGDPALRSDGKVAVQWIGAEGEPGGLVGARLAGGAIASPLPALESDPQTATVHVPVFADADPIAVPVIGLSFRLTPDGRGGFDGQLNGAVRATVLGHVAYLAMQQMVSAHPEDHRLLILILDDNHDGVITEEEFLANPLIANIMAPDVRLFDAAGRWAPSDEAGVARDGITLGFAFHLVPCASGSCRAPVAARCDDRVRNGSETGVDCGGSCAPCPSGLSCTVDSDCQSRRCDGRRCAAATCSDGVRDGFEADVDCGPGCGRCAAGKACVIDADCMSNRCASDGTRTACRP